MESRMRQYGIFTCMILLLSFGTPSIAKPNFPGEEPESKPLLRVLPAFRQEECEWAIRWDVCLKCVRQGIRYAQRIHFYPSGVYREHGCYTEEEGFFLLENR
ncbi:hypothetical protein EHO61_05390 [Leptospira fluminis]|uniref:Uncharacterized protein n=1 Tax=Leptospira fluminis TaxID=2484979 RepID=A0A4R9GQG1_9LEPT|nr:hypothetical protein EHO61_05390 [Leptospira fluminis]